jgi:hypothetical protein
MKAIGKYTLLQMQCAMSSSGLVANSGPTTQDEMMGLKAK